MSQPKLPKTTVFDRIKLRQQFKRDNENNIETKKLIYERLLKAGWQRKESPAIRQLMANYQSKIQNHEVTP